MPPPRLPKAASGLAVIAGTTVTEITRRQGTDVSVSDVTRGVYKALQSGLSVVDYTFANRVTQEAHAAAQHGLGHNSPGYCIACGAIYDAVTKSLEANNRVED